MAFAYWPLTPYDVEGTSEFTEQVPVEIFRDGGPNQIVAMQTDVAIPRRWRFTLPIDNAERKQVFDFIRDTLAMGTLPFLFRDGRDPKVTAHALGTGTGAATVFSWATTRSSAVYGHYPLNDATTVLYVNAVAVATGSRTIGVDARQVTFSVAPVNTHPVTVDYYYYRLCRLAQGPVIYRPSSSIWQQTELEIVEVFR